MFDAIPAPQVVKNTHFVAAIDFPTTRAWGLQTSAFCRRFLRRRRP
jgi:hypothetical protein